MAKIIKVTGYLVVEDDVDEKIVEETAKEILSSKFDGIGQCFQTKSRSLGKNLFYEEDWNNHPLNSIDCKIETCESYFK